MIAVIFEVKPKQGQKDAYLETATQLKSSLTNIDGFISIERFQSLADSNKLLSLSFWRDEAAVTAWRALPLHRNAQSAGRDVHFANYRLRVAEVDRDYGLNEREQAPRDSRAIHDLSQKMK